MFRLPFGISLVLVLGFTFSTSVRADLVLSEVFYDAAGSDNGLEWIELFNDGAASIDLAGYSIGYGGNDYTYGTYQLSGTIGSGQYFVVGGTTSSAANGNPIFNLAQDFDPDIQNSGTTADGIALFDDVAANITAVTLPIDVVIYGGTNSNSLFDETGSVGTPDVGDAPVGQSITFNGNSWAITPGLTPGGGNLSISSVPEPSALAASLLIFFVAARRRRI